MISEDILSLIYFAAFWIQPIIMMPLWFIRTDKLNTFWYFPLIFGPLIYGFMPKTDAVNLIYFYYCLGFLLVAYLVRASDWELPRAVVASSLLVFAGSFYWELPYILRNAYLVGFEWDWLVHAIGIIPLLFIRDYVGWNFNRRNLALVGVGLLISTAIMLAAPIAPGTGSGVEWNSPLYLFNRAACTLILFNAMNRDWGKLK